MFKLVVLSALIALSVAAPSGLHHGVVAYQAAPVITAHSAIVGSVPTSVSQHSSSVVHSAAIAAPAVAYAAAPAVAVAHAAPAVAVAHASPVVTAHSAIVGSVPTSVSQHSSSVVHSAALAAPTLYAAHAPAVYAAHAPAVYAAHSPAVVAAQSPVLAYSTHGLVNAHGAHVVNAW